MILFILGLLTGFFKAIMDTIQFHKYTSRLSYFINKHFPFMYEWYLSIWNRKWNHWTHWLYPSDGWHMSQNIIWLLVTLAIIYSKGRLLSAIYFFIGYALGFNLFFEIIFANRKGE